MSKSIFVGNKSTPNFLVEITKNKLMNVYKPDKYSKDEDFYEKYTLGNLVLTTKYDDILFIEKVVSYKKLYFFTPIIIIRIKKKYLIISTNIKEK
jgi:hypothetical protein